MRIAIHVLIWVIAVLFITDQIIKLSNKDNKNVNVKASSTILSSDDSKKSNSVPVDPNAIITKAILDNSLVEIEKVIGNGSELIINGSITNQGSDGFLKFCAEHCQNMEATKVYDDFGNKVICNFMQIGNQSDRFGVEAKLISGIKVPIKMKFNMPTVGGQTQAKRIALLEIYADNGNRIKCEFRNLKVEKVGSQSTPTATPSPVITPAVVPSVTPSPTITPVSTAKIDN